ncbi:hypothetical protein TSUD_45670 [Trifolium subterraneum]|nr:hypothetical protein TSUD_45670 [Trifolium subterraneum]
MEKTEIQVPRVKLGTQGLEVSRLGFGCGGLSGNYSAPLSHEDGCSIIKEVFNRGVTFFDTSDLYGHKHDNEIMVEALCTCRELDIGIVAYSPLGRGFFAGKSVVEALPSQSLLNFENNIGSLTVKLTEEDLKEIFDAVPVEEIAGEREYDSLSQYLWKFATTPAK